MWNEKVEGAWERDLDMALEEGAGGRVALEGSE